MIVQLISVNRKSGNTEADKSRIGMKFSVFSAMEGHGAILPIFGDEGRALLTSKIEKVNILDGRLTIKTRNTEYEFEILINTNK